MKFVIQRVSEASVRVDGQIAGQIEKGFLVLVGIAQEDTEAIADKLVNKMSGLRIFEDAQGKTNLSLADVDGQVLMISQFTLYADCRRGNRPGFSYAAKPEKANDLYEYVLAKTREKIPVVEKGVFGADMKVSLINDGPFTIILDSEQL